MMFLLTVLLVIGAVACLIVGLITSSSSVYLAAAALSAAAVLILARFLNVSREKTFVTHAPPQTEPVWDAPLVEPEEDLAGGRLPVVAIENYEDLVAAEILPSLETLSIEQLQAVIRRERQGLRREGIIARAEKLVDLTRGSDLDLREAQMQAAAARPTARRRSAANRREAEAEPPANPSGQRKPNEKAPDLSL